MRAASEHLHEEYVYSCEWSPAAALQTERHTMHHTKLGVAILAAMGLRAPSYLPSTASAFCARSKGGPTAVVETVSRVSDNFAQLYKQACHAEKTAKDGKTQARCIYVEMAAATIAGPCSVFRGWDASAAQATVGFSENTRHVCFFACNPDRGKKMKCSSSGQHQQLDCPRLRFALFDTLSLSAHHVRGGNQVKCRATNSKPTWYSSTGLHARRGERSA